MTLAPLISNRLKLLQALHEALSASVKEFSKEEEMVMAKLVKLLADGIHIQATVYQRNVADRKGLDG